VIAETILCEPIFPGKSAVDQLVEIIKVIGTPTSNDILAMNPDYKPNTMKIPVVKPIELKNVIIFQFSNGFIFSYLRTSAILPQSSFCLLFLFIIHRKDLRLYRPWRILISMR
jgi:hypothetical protein